jgi:hypothetical protein
MQTHLHRAANLQIGVLTLVPGRPHEDPEEVSTLCCPVKFTVQPAYHRPRYSEFEDLHQKLVQTFPHAGSSMPQFPPKSVICKHTSSHSHPAHSANHSIDLLADLLNAA